jgi:hypothetical protein
LITKDEIFDVTQKINRHTGHNQRDFFHADKVSFNTIIEACAKIGQERYRQAERNIPESMWGNPEEKVITLISAAFAEGIVIGLELAHEIEQAKQD